MNKLFAPAQLWIGQARELAAQCYVALHTVLCGCAEEACLTRQQLAARQHPAVTILTPEKTVYLKQQIEDVFALVRYQREVFEHYFIVFEKAELLSPSSGNSLLKLLEEPPKGYHFIFCAPRKDALLPTIVSRCVVHFFEQEEGHEQYREFFDVICNASSVSLPHFVRMYERYQLTDAQAPLLIEYLQLYATQSNHRNAARVRTVMESMSNKLPMPGSSKLFWRTVFLACMASE